MSATESTLHERVRAVSRTETDEDRLLTAVVAPGDSVGELRERVAEDRAEAEYIDTGGTDQHRLDALERALDILREYDRTPDGVGAFLRFPLE